MPTGAYILTPIIDGQDRLEHMLRECRIGIGWAQARGLDNPALAWTEFGESLKQQCFADVADPLPAANATTQLWRFLRGMQPEDWILVPYGMHFYVAQVAGPVRYGEEGWTRPVRWLAEQRPVLRGVARSELVARMRHPGPCVDASDLLQDVEECVALACGRPQAGGHSERFHELVDEMLGALHSESTDRHGFERLIQSVMLGLGAAECLIHDPPLPGDAGLTATFRIGKGGLQTVPVHTGCWRPDAQLDAHTLEDFESAVLSLGGRHGLIATCAQMPETAARKGRSGVQLDILDGSQLAHLAIEHGIRGAL